MSYCKKENRLKMQHYSDISLCFISIPYHNYFLNCTMFLPCHFRDPKCLNLDNILGFILNVPSDYKLGFVLLPLRRRHWVTIRQVHGTYYNLDSKLESPQLIGRVSEKQFGQVTYFNDCDISTLNVCLRI